MNDPQTTSHILMVRPSSFGFNTDTAMSNVFQAAPIHQQAAQISLEATKEFDELVHTLVRAGIQVMVVEDTPQPVKPDAVFQIIGLQHILTAPSLPIRCRRLTEEQNAEKTS